MGWHGDRGGECGLNCDAGQRGDGRVTHAHGLDTCVSQCWWVACLTLDMNPKPTRANSNPNLNRKFSSESEKQKKN